MNKEVLVLKVGGSIFSLSEDNIFDWSVVTRLKETLLPFTDRYQFILCSGGGYLAKKYQKIVRDSGGSERELNWAGTSACNHHAVMFRCVFGDLAEDNPVLADAVDLETSISFAKPFLCVGAAKPEYSSDTDAVLMAKRAGVKTVYSLKNVDGVYTDDPNKNSDAQFIPSLSWDDYIKTINVTEFTPKLALPVDPVATKHASESNLSFKIMNGNDFENLSKALKGDDFRGTTIG